MILIKDDDENIPISKILSTLGAHDSAINTIYHLAIRLVDNNTRKIEYSNGIGVRELKKKLEEVSAQSMRDVDPPEHLRNKFIIVTSSNKDDIKIMPTTTKHREKTGVTYNKVLAYFGKFKIPDSKNGFMDQFINFLTRYDMDEINTFIRVKSQRVKKPNELNYWDFLINDDDENLALVTLDAPSNDLILLSDNFVQTKECSSLKIADVAEKPPWQTMSETKTVNNLYGEEALFDYSVVD